MQRNSYLKSYVDRAARQFNDKMDDGHSVYARQLVTETLKTLFKYEYRATLWANGELLNIDTSVNEGANEFGWMETGDVGTADIVAPGATDIPTADIQGNWNIGKVYTIATSITYSTQDVRQAKFQGLFSIAEQKAVAAREAHDRKLDELIRMGSQPHGLMGVGFVPGSFHVAAPTGTWLTATPAQIVADFTAGYSAVFNGTEGIERPNTAVFPSTIWTRISTLQNSIASDITVLEYLKRAFPEITAWVCDPGMNTISDAGGPAVLIYSDDSSRMQAVMPMLLRPNTLEVRGLGFTMAFESRYAGVMAPRPLSMCKLQGI